MAKTPSPFNVARWELKVHGITKSFVLFCYVFMRWGGGGEGGGFLGLKINIEVIEG